MLNKLFKELIINDSPSENLLRLHKTGKLKEILPEVDILFGIPQPEMYHPEIDTGVHICMVTDYAWKKTKNLDVLLAALLHDVGKGITPENEWPKHRDHEKNGIPLILNINKRLNVNSYQAKLNEIVCEHHLRIHRALESKPGSIIQLLEKLNLFEDNKLLNDILVVCESDARGRKGLTNKVYDSPEYIKEVVSIKKPLDGLTRDIWLSQYIHNTKPILYKYLNKDVSNDFC